MAASKFYRHKLYSYTDTAHGQQQKFMGKEKKISIDSP